MSSATDLPRTPSQAAQRIVEILECAWRDPNLEPYARFWRDLIAAMDDAGLLCVNVEDPSAVLPGVNIANVMARGSPSLTSTTIGQLASGVSIRLRPSAQSDMNEETPFGLFRTFSAFPQPPGEFVVFAPCVTSILERILFYPTAMARAMLNAVHGLDDKRIDPALVQAQRLRRAVADWAGVEVAPRIQRVLSTSIRMIKSQFPVYPIFDETSFYEEGSRFYSQGSGTYFVSSSTPGLILPHEFYGNGVYYPGITDEFPPEKFNFMQDNRLISSALFDRWDGVVSTAASNGQNVNVQRPFYFASGLGASRRGKAVVYGFSRETAESELQATLSGWPTTDVHRYANDCRVLIHWVFSRPDIRLRAADGPLPAPNQRWTLVAGGGRKFDILSFRGSNRAIARGLKISFGSLATAGAAISVLAALLDGGALGLGAGASASVAFAAWGKNQESIARNNILAQNSETLDSVDAWISKVLSGFAAQSPRGA